MWRVWLTAVVWMCGALAAPAAAQSRSRDAWVALARGGFIVPASESAAGLLVEMNALLASPDPVLRDEVAYAAAERWILRDRAVAPDDVRRLMALWSANLTAGLGASGDDGVFRRSFSALCLSLVAAREVTTPFLDAGEAQALADRLLDYLARERDLRGFDPAHGWIHAVAHTADAFKFLARGRHWAPDNLDRLLRLMSAKADDVDGVFQWGEPQRIGFALAAAVRRPDADLAVVERWVDEIGQAFRALWARGPVVAPAAFARVENRLQILRGLHTALAMDGAPTPQGEAARRAVIVALARMR